MRSQDRCAPHWYDTRLHRSFTGVAAIAALPNTLQMLVAAVGARLVDSFPGDFLCHEIDILMPS